MINIQEELVSRPSFYKPRTIYTTTVISLTYLLVSVLLVGFKSDQLVLLFIFNTFFYLSDATRRFILGFSIFIVYWIIFDYMKAFPNYLFREVHIRDLYELEKNIFGIEYHGRLLTPNEYWKLNTNDLLDVLTGIFYLMWVPVPLAFAAYLFFKDKEQFLYFSLTFVWVNFIGFVIYYAFPAAPPWYIQQHGYHFFAETPGSTGGLERFDRFFHIHLFQGIYSKGSNVFAAMPSLHSAYPLIVCYYGFKNRLKWTNLFFIMVMIGIWFAAIYNSHHYVMDVLAGVFCSIVGIVSFRGLLNWERFKVITDLATKCISPVQPYLNDKRRYFKKTKNFV